MVKTGKTNLVDVEVAVEDVIVVAAVVIVTGWLILGHLAAAALDVIAMPLAQTRLDEVEVEAGGARVPTPLSLIRT
jgi:hypothetical protein